MTPGQKAILALSESRKVLSAHLGIGEELRSADWATDLDKLTKAVQSRDAEVAATSLAEPIPEERRDDAQGGELRAMITAANVGAIFEAVMEHRAIDGREGELQRHYGLASNSIPLALLREELRAVTPGAGEVGQSQQPILDYVFPMSVGAFLGVDMPTVPVGDAVFPVLTSKLTVTAAAENGTAPETTGAFSADVLTPARLQASFFYSREDRARFAGMDAALRENLSMGLGDALDAQIVNGTNGLLNGTVLANHNVTTETTYELYREQFAYGRVDGRFAGTAGDIRIVMGSGAYAHAAAQYRGNNDNMDALASLMAATGGVRVSAHVPIVASTRQNAVIRLGNRRDMVAPIWEGIALIPDEITKAGDGQIVITAVMLHNVKVVRAEGFYKQQTQHA